MVLLIKNPESYGGCEVLEEIVETGIRIRNYRKSVKMTLKELAKRTDISVTTLQRIETGKVSPSVVALSQIAYHLKKPIISFSKTQTSKALFIRKPKT